MLHAAIRLVFYKLNDVCSIERNVNCMIMQAQHCPGKNNMTLIYIPV